MKGSRQGRPNFEVFCRWADEYVAGLPEQLLEGLTGGIHVERERRRNPDDPPGVCLLGEYIVDPYLGSFIVLYYGSFAQVLAGQPAETWRSELEETIRHELRHHLEDRAGVDWLGEEDREELLRLWAEAMPRPEGKRDAKGERQP